MVAGKCTAKAPTKRTSRKTSSARESTARWVSILWLQGEIGANGFTSHHHHHQSHGKVETLWGQLGETFFFFMGILAGFIISWLIFLGRKEHYHHPQQIDHQITIINSNQSHHQPQFLGIIFGATSYKVTDPSFED